MESNQLGKLSLGKALKWETKTSLVTDPAIQEQASEFQHRGDLTIPRLKITKLLILQQSKTILLILLDPKLIYKLFSNTLKEVSQDLCLGIKVKLLNNWRITLFLKFKQGLDYKEGFKFKQIVRPDKIWQERLPK